MNVHASVSRGLFSSSEKRRRRRQKPAHLRRLFFENLEPRIVLASTVSLSSGDLQVMGGLAADHLRFSTSGTNLVVNDSTGITAGSGVTQVNSTTVQVLLAAVTGTLNVDTSDGTDTLAFGTINLGAADIKIRNVETVSVDANAGVTAAGGFDVESDSFTTNSKATVSTRRIASGDPVTADSTANSGDISIVAHNIAIQAGSRLLAHVEEASAFEPGKVGLKIDSSTIALPFIPQVSLTDISITIGGSGEKTMIRGGEIEIEGSIKNDITSPKRVLGFTDQTVGISIENTSLEAESVSVVAESEDKSLLEDLPEWVTANFIEPFGEFLVDKFLPKTPVSAMLRGAKATVTVTDSEIHSENDVTLKSSSVVDASTEAVAAFDEILKIAHRFSAGYSQATSTAKTALRGDSQIQAGGDVTIGTDAETTAVVTARTTSNINLESPASARDVVVSLAITNSHSTSQATVDEGASITADGNVSITSKGKIKNNAKSGATTYIDGAGGLSVSLAFDTSDIGSTVDGRVVSGGTDVTRDVVVADVSGSMMTIPNHGFRDGQIIEYRARDPNDPNAEQDPIGGLLSGEKLRVIVVDDNTIQLARVGPLDIDNTGADPASIQTFSRRDTILFNPQTAVDPSTSTITLAGHGFTAGQQLDYGVSSEDDEAIGGLEDQTAYFVIPTGSNTFQLAATAEDAKAATPIAITMTDRGTGTSHIFAFHETATPFSPSADFDSATETFTVPGHGFSTGDALVYATDSSLIKQTVFSRTAVFDPTNRTSTFNPTGTVDLGELVVNISTDTIAMVNHNLATGDEVTYQSHGGQPIGGLTDGANYFVIKVDERYLQLAATASDAADAAAIDFEAGATLGNSPHELTTVVAPRTIFFDPTGTVPEPVVNTRSDTVLITPFHNYVAGQRVRYQTGGGTPIGGLSNNAYYFAIPVNQVAFQLAASREAALAGAAIDLAAGATGSGHQFATNEVDTIGNLIVSPAHEMETGEKVTYRKGQGSAIAPLNDGAEYYVIRLDDNAIRLANTLHEASIGAFIDLLSTGSGTMQGLQRDTIVSAFDPTRTAPVVDLTLDTIELPGHGLNTGDAVNYQASGGDPIGGLADNTNYFAIRVDEDHIQLAADFNAATNGTAISLSAGATLGAGVHVLRVVPEVVIAEFPDRLIDFDPTLVPALDTALNTIRLPNHRLSTADALTYLAGGGSPIGGLTNGQEYFVIVAGDDTIQLAASAAEAHAGNALNLSSGATGDRHGLQRVSAIAQRDPALRGLTNAEIYFAIVLDADRFQLAEAAQDALAAAPIVMDAGQATGTVHEVKPVDEETGVLVAADLTADNRAISGAGIGSEPTLSDLLTKAELQTSLAGIRGILHGDFKSRFEENEDIHGSGTTTNSLFSGAAGISLNMVDHTVLAQIGATAEIRSDENFTQRSTISQKTQVTAQGNVSLGSAKKFATGVAVSLGFYTNDVQSIVDGNGTDGASIDAAAQIDISSDVEYPLLVEPLELLPFSSFYDGSDEYNIIGDLSTFLNGSLGLTRIMNVWSASKVFTTKSANLPKVAISGSLGYTEYTNTSQAIVRSGAKLNQDVQGDEQKVSVAATTGMELVSVTGIMHLKLNEDGLRKAFTDKDSTSSFARAGNFFSFFGNKSSTFGMGGSAMIQFMDNTTTALIEGGAAVYSGDNGGLEVSSSQDIYSLEFAQSGGDSGSIGISASIVWVDQTSHTIAHLDSGVAITGGPVSVQADDQSTHTSIAGSAQLAKRLGIGVAFALLNADRTTLAIAGKQRTDDDETIGSAGTSIDVRSLNLEATSTGKLWSFGLVGALASNIPTGSPAQQNGNAGPVQATSGVALAGDAAVNTVTDTTQAYINDGGTITGGDITLDADDDTRISTLTGAGAISAKPDGTIGGALAGSFSYNKLDLTTESFIIGATITAAEITLDATSHGGILAISGGLAGALAKTSVTIAGSFSWNVIDSTVRAYVDRTLMQQLTNLKLSADDTSTVQADGGAASVALSRATQGMGGAVAFGVSAAINKLTPAVKAYLTDSIVTGAARVDVGAESTAEVTAITWAGALAGAASGTSGLQVTGAGAGSGNSITTTVEAAILGGSDVSTVSGGDIRLTATDTPTIEANAGGVALSVELNSGTNVPVAIGAAASYNEITGGSIKARIDHSTATAGGAVALQATSEPTIKAQSISLSVGAAMSGGSGSGVTFDGAGAGAGNTIGNATEASINGGSTATTTGTGSVIVNATDTSKITAVAPAISLSFVTAQSTAFSLDIGISITSNEISNTLKANIDESTVAAAGGLDLKADSTATSDSVAVAAVPTLTISQSNSISLSGVGAQAFNTIVNDVEASITGGSQVLAAGDLNITASDASTINANVVAATIAVNVGENATGNLTIDAALATNKIGQDGDRNTVRAFIADSLVAAAGAIDIAATSQADITGLTVGTGLALSATSGASFALNGFGANTINTVRNDVEAAVLGTSNVSATGGGNITLRASESDAPKIKAEATGGSLSGSLGGNSFSGAITVGVVLTDNDVANTIVAHVDDATVCAGGDVRLDAGSTSDIESLTVFVSLSIALGENASIAGAGDGANSTNTINNTIEAYILDSNSTVTTGGGSVLLNATDEATINAQAGGGNFALAIASNFAGSIAVAVVLATNDIQNTVQSYLHNATVNAAGDVRLTTTSQPVITATTVSVSLSGAGTAEGVAGTGTVAASQSTNTISSTIAAHITASHVVADGAVQVLSNSTQPSSGANINATAPAVSVGVALTDPFAGVAFALTGAGGSVTNESTSGIQAFIDGGSVVAAAGAVEVAASDTTNLDGDVVDVTVALSEIAGSIAVALVTNTYANDVRGYVEQADVSSTSDTIRVTANSSPTATGTAVPVAVAVEASGDGANSTSDINGSVEAFVAGQAVLTAGQGTVTVQATSTADTQADANGGGGALLTISALLANASIGQTTKAHVSGGSTINAAGLHVVADSTKANATANVLVVNIAGISGAGGKADAEISGDVIAFIGSELGSTPPVAPTTVHLGNGTLSVQASAESTTAHADGRGGAGGVVEVSVLVPFAEITSDTMAYVGEGTIVAAGTLTVDATAHLTANGTSLVIGIAGLTGDGVNATAKITDDSHTAAFVGPAAGNSGSGATTSIALTSGDASVTSTLIGLATTDITVGSGAVIAAADGTVVNSEMSGRVDAYLGDNVNATTPGDVSVHSTSNSGAHATSFGVNVGGIVSAFGTKTTSTLNPTLNAFTGSGVTIAARHVSVLASHNVDGTGAPLADKKVQADGTAGSGSLIAGGEGANVEGTLSPTIDTRLGAGTVVQAAGTVTVATRSYQFADVNAHSDGAAGIVAVGVTLATGKSQGTINTHIDGHIMSADSVVLESTVTAEVDAFGEANGGALGAAGEGTNVQATVGSGDTNNPLIATYVSDSGQIASTHNIKVQSLLTTDAAAKSSGYAFAGVASVGSVPATSTVQPVVRTRIDDGATVISSAGNVRVASGHNFDPISGDFLSDKLAFVSTDNTTGAIVVSVADTAITADAKADVATILAHGATINAIAGLIDVESRSSNLANAHLTTSGGGVVFVGLGDAKGKAHGVTSVQVLTDLEGPGGGIGASNVSVVAQASDISNGRITQHGGGGISVNDSHAEAETMPTVSVTIDGAIRAAENITVDADSFTDADANITNASGGLIDVTDYDATVTVTPHVSATVSDNAVLAAGNTLSISVNHGRPAADLSDGTFDAAAQVDPADDTISFSKDHGVQTGASVTYDAQGNAVIGGLGDQRTYGVIVTGDKSLQLGGTFQAQTPVPNNPAGVNLLDDTIIFAAPHNLEGDGQPGTSDRVLYAVPSGSTAVGGLQAGTAYLVNVVDAITIRLVDPSDLPAAALAFGGTSIGLDQQTITINGHQFTLGQPVTYSAAAAAVTSSFAVDVDVQTDGSGNPTGVTPDPNADNIYLGSDVIAEQGFQNGDVIIYTAGIDPSTGDPAPIGGLIHGGRYAVIFDTGMPNQIQLGETATPATPIALDPTGVPTNVSQSLRKVNDQPIGGLADQRTYYVADVTANTFRLAPTAADAQAGTNIITLDPTDPATGNVLTGIRNTLGTRGVDLTGVGAGRHHLVVDITSASAGTQQLVGIGGAAGLAGAPSGDGIATASVSGGGGGAVSVESAATTSTSTPTSTLTIGQSAWLDANSISLAASSAGNVGGSADNNNGGFVAVSSGRSSVSTTNAASVVVGDSATIHARDNIAINSTTSESANTITDISSSGFAGIPTANAKAHVDYASKIDIYAATITAGNQLTLAAESNLSGNVTATADGSGVGSGSSANDASGQGMYIGSSSALTQTAIHGGAQLSADTISVQATVTSVNASVNATAEGSGLGGNSNAKARLEMTDTTEVAVNSNASLIGQTVNLSSTHNGIVVTSTSNSRCDCFGGADNSTALTDYNSHSNVNAQPSAFIAASNLTASADQNVTTYDRHEKHGGGFLVFGGHHEEGSFNAHRDISWNATVGLPRNADPQLVVDGNGTITVDNGVTVTTDTGQALSLGDTVPAGRTIVVENIVNNVAGSVVFEANVPGNQDDMSPPRGTITGSQAVFEFHRTFGSVEISNASSRDLQVNGVEVFFTPDPNHTEITINVQTDSGFSFGVSNEVAPTTVVIENTHPTAAPLLIINGVIDNPIGLTTVTNASGDIVATAIQAVVRTNELRVTAPHGNIGQTGGTIGDHRVNVQLVQSSGRPTALESRAGVYNAMSIQGLLRDPSVADFRPNLDLVAAGNDVDLLLPPGLLQTTPGSGGISANVGETGRVVDFPSISVPPASAPSPARVTTVVDHWPPAGFGPAPVTDLGLQGSGTATIDTSYEFTGTFGAGDLRRLQAGNGITFRGCAAGGCGTVTSRVNVIGNVVLTSLTAGVINGNTNGSIDLTEAVAETANRAMRVGVIESTNRWVMLTVPDTAAAGENLIMFDSSLLGPAGSRVNAATSVTMHVGDNLFMAGSVSAPAMSSQINAGTTVLIQGDRTAPDPDPGVGAVIDLRGLISGNLGGTITESGALQQVVHVQTGEDADIVSLTNVATGAGTTIQTNGGNDHVQAGSNAMVAIGDNPPASWDPQNTGGVLHAILALLTIDGGAGDDFLSADDSGDQNPDSGVLTFSTITGFQMTAGIVYGAIEDLVITLGQAGDVLDVDSTNPTTNSQIFGNAGNDTINVAKLANPPVAAPSCVPTADTVDCILGALHVYGGDGYDTMNVIGTGQTEMRGGAMTGTTITGLNMGFQGIEYGTLEVVDILLGQANDYFVVAGTAAPQGNGNTTITAVHGGGGQDALIVAGGGGPSSPLVLYGDFTGTGTPDRDYIDASASSGGVMVDGNEGNDTIVGSQGNDNLAGSAGDDSIAGQGGDDNILGDSGFEVDLQTRVTAIITTHAGGRDTLDGGPGDDALIGDHGVLIPEPGELLVITTTAILRLATANDSVGDVDWITGGAGNDIIVGGQAGDVLFGNAGDGLPGAAPDSDAILGDNGEVLFWAARIIASMISQSPSDGGDDQISAGADADYVIGGVGSDFIITAGNMTLAEAMLLIAQQNYDALDPGDAARDVVIGDNGEIRFDESGNLTRAESNEPAYAGEDTIVTGNGPDVAIGGTFDDLILVGGDDNAADLAIGDNGRATFGGTGSSGSASADDGTIVSFNFFAVGGTTIIAGEAGAGQARAANWNNLASNGYTVFGDEPAELVLFDNGSQAPGVSIAWGALYSLGSLPPYPLSGALHSNLNLSGEDAKLFEGLLYMTTNFSVAVDLAGLSNHFSSYDVYVYVDADDLISNPNHSVRKISDGTTSYYLDDPDGHTFDGTYVETTSTDPSSPELGNYVVFRGLTGDTASIRVDDDNTVSGGNAAYNRPSISAIQVVGQGIRSDVIETLDAEFGGDDIIRTGGGPDIAIGGSGADDIQTFGDSADEELDDDVVIGDNAMTVVDGGKIRDIRSTAIESAATPAVGDDDTILTGGGSDFVIGGNGSDWIDAGSAGPDSEYDADIVFGDSAKATGVGQRRVQIESLSPANGDATFASDTIIGGAGADVIIGGNGDDDLRGGGGADTIFGDNATVLLMDGQIVGADVLPFNPYNVPGITLLGNTIGGTDTLEGGPGDDLIYGQFGDDLFVFAGSGLGSDFLVEAGNEIAYPNDAWDHLDLSGFDATAELQLGQTFKQLVNRTVVDGGVDLAITFNSSTAFERITGTRFGDILSGNSRPNWIDAGEGDNRVHLGSNQTTVLAGSGNDQVDGGNAVYIISLGDGDNAVHVGHGANTITTGAGNDTIVAGDGGNVIDAGDGNNDVRTGRGADRVTVGDGISVITTDMGNDVVIAGNGNHTISTGAGDDEIRTGDGDNNINAGDGDNVVVTGNGHDTIVTGSGSDIIDAGHGNNNVKAGYGNDQITTGDGHDVIDGNVGNDFIRSGGGNDVITASSGNDIVIAGDGDDKIYATTGRNILIGGRGSDLIDGGNLDDILISSRTTYDDNDAALLAILNQWLSTTAYTTRITAIRNGPNPLNSTTVIDDDEVDTLFGRGGSDWFFASVDDLIKDRSSGEVVDRPG